MSHIFYLAVLAAYLILFVLSRREPLFTDKPVTVPEILFRRTAVFLYVRCRGRFLRKGRRKRRSDSRNAVMTNLQLLYSAGEAKKQYFLLDLKKITIFLIFLFAADIAAVSVNLSKHFIQSPLKNGFLYRKEYGQGTERILLQEQELGGFSLEVPARKYDRTQLEILADKLAEELPRKILGENRSAEEIREPLMLIGCEKGYPFKIYWESSAPEILSPEGAVYNRSFREEERKDVLLTASLAEGKFRREIRIPVRVCGMPVDEQERIRAEIEEELKIRNEGSLEQEGFFLPDGYGERAFSWEIEERNKSFLLFCLLTGAGAAAIWGADRELSQKVREREKELEFSYSKMAEKFVLYIGAGMSVRNVFLKMTEEYTARDGYLYTELKRLCGELNSGIAETEVYRRFGMRCCLPQYTRFCTLLVQNLQKGNNALIGALEEEVQTALTERTRMMRRKGEEAGTKLLLPMMIMLVITMLMIMIPAYTGFSLS